jgi:hypothetical protein
MKQFVRMAKRGTSATRQRNGLRHCNLQCDAVSEQLPTHIFICDLLRRKLLASTVSSGAIWNVIRSCR